MYLFGPQMRRVAAIEISDRRPSQTVVPPLQLLRQVIVELDLAAAAYAQIPLRRPHYTIVAIHCCSTVVRQALAPHEAGGVLLVQSVSSSESRRPMT